MECHQGPGPILTAVCLAAIVALGLALRLYRIGEESAWWDEYASLMHLGAPSLWKFLTLSHTLDPATFPLYFTLEYLWWHYAGASVHSLRLLSILIGLSCIPVLYAFGRDLFGKRAGLTAALCMAVSPVHIHHAQGIRMYVLVALLALLSSWTFMRLVRSWEKRWWAAHLLCNLLLLWTHPFAALMLGVEAAYIVVFCARPLKCAAAWMGCTFLVALPSLFYLGEVRFWSPQSTSAWLKAPPFGEFLGDLLFDDVVNFSCQLRLSDYWAASPLRNALDLALAMVLLGACAWLGWRLWKQRGTDRNAFRAFVFLGAWLLLPATVLYVASVVTRPCIFPRYTLHSSLAMYLTVGGAVAAVRERWKALGAALAIAGLIGFQWVALQPGPQRTDWQSAAAEVRGQAHPQDLVLVHVNLWRDVFRYNLGASKLAIASAESVQTLAGQAGFYLDQNRPSDAEKGAAVWAVVLQPYFDSGPNPEFEAALKALGLAFTRTEFCGIEHVLVYRVTHAGSGPIEWRRRNSGNREEMSNAISDLALELVEAGNHRSALEALRWLFETDPDAQPVYGGLQLALLKRTDAGPEFLAVRALLKAYHALGRGDFATAQEASREALRHNPKYAPAHANLSVTALLLDDDEAAALECLRKANSLDDHFKGLFGVLVEQWAAKNYQACFDILQHTDAQPEFRDWFKHRAEAVKGGK